MKNKKNKMAYLKTAEIVKHFSEIKSSKPIRLDAQIYHLSVPKHEHNSLMFSVLDKKNCTIVPTKFKVFSQTN